MADYAATCTITRKNQIIKVFTENVTFKDGKLSGYSDILKKLQAEVNQALTEIVDQENAGGEDAKQGTKAEDESNESPETPKRKYNTRSQNSPMRASKKCKQ